MTEISKLVTDVNMLNTVVFVDCL